MKKQLLFLSVMAITFSHAQVSLVKDINPGAADAMPSYLKNRIVYNGNLIFAAKENSNFTNHRLWFTDGSSTNTISISIAEDPTEFYFSNITNEVFFSGLRGSSGREPYRTNGTSSGTNILIDLNPSSSSSTPISFMDWAGRVHFSARHPVSGEELIGISPSNTVYVAEDIWSGINGSKPQFLTPLNGTLFFSARSLAGGSTQNEFYIKTATSSPATKIDIYPGNGSSDPASLTTFNNKIYFAASDGINGRELWVSDGTVAGTQRLFDINPVAGDLEFPENLTVFNNSLYFTATHPTLGIEIFKLSGNTITNLKNINSGAANSSPFGLTVYNGNLYFAADNGINGVELWKSGGFSSNTNLLKNINPSSESTPQGFVEYFGELFFNADDGINGRELWKTDGTNAGTVLVSDINTGALDSDPLDLIVAGDNLFFSATTATTGRELWKYIDPSLSVSDVELENNISLFPNPTKNSFSIETNTIIETIFIYDVQGKLMKSFTENLEVYNIEELTSGIYFVNITTEKGSATKKLIKD